MEKINEISIAAFAGGCFWCTEAVFQRLKGVKKVVSGFMGGDIKNPAYREVVQGRTSHAEAIQIEFDPQQTTYLQLLEVFFATHDPTTLNRQQNDVGTQYRSAIFYYSAAQRNQAKKSITLLNETHFEGKITTQLVAASTFYPAEEVHQNFYTTHRNFPYCEIIIDPKIKKLKQLFPELYTANEKEDFR